MKDTPVLLIVFNRPDTTAKVFEAIRKAKPRRLFVAADGARPGKPGENEICDETRRVATAVDWECELKTFFRDQNVGCGRGPSEAMNWFFSQVEFGIVLEDDCVPDPSFFDFCGELLEYYKNDERVMHVGGTNSQFGRKRNNYSYYFSKYPHIWGWATWARAWKKFQFSFSEADGLRLPAIFTEYGFSESEKKYWLDHWEIVKDGQRKDIWDVQWTFSVWLNHGLTIVPGKNLISNIGFDGNATHTTDTQSKLAALATEPMDKILHPPSMTVNIKADKYTFENYNLLQPSSFARFRNWVVGFIPPTIRSKMKKALS